MTLQTFSTFSDTPISPGRNLRVVTPDNDADLPDGACKSLWVTADGDLTVIAQDDTDPVTIPVLAGQCIPIRARRVLATGTTATLVAIY